MPSDNQSPIVPAKYAGQWIAWNNEKNKIIGSGSTLQEVRKEVKDAGAIFVQAPKENTRFVGTI